MLGLDNPFSRERSNEDNMFGNKKSYNNNMKEFVVVQAENPEDIQLDDDDSDDQDDGDDQVGASNSAVDPSIQAILP
jgi:hypothetical protein